MGESKRGYFLTLPISIIKLLKIARAKERTDLKSGLFDE